MIDGRQDLQSVSLPAVGGNVKRIYIPAQQNDPAKILLNVTNDLVSSWQWQWQWQ